MALNFLKAQASDTNDVFRLYQSLIGTRGCTWNEEYPTLKHVQEDIAKDGIYYLQSNGRMIAAAFCGHHIYSIGEPWSGNIENICVLARIAVAADWQGKGVGEALLRQIINEARARGFGGIGLLVSPSNISALKLYKKTGFDFTRQIQAFGGDWQVFELKF